MLGSKETQSLVNVIATLTTKLSTSQLVSVFHDILAAYGTSVGLYTTEFCGEHGQVSSSMAWVVCLLNTLIKYSLNTMFPFNRLIRFMDG